MEVLQHLIKKYDPATVFVSAATIVVCIELAIMRILVPTPSTAGAIEEVSFVEQICTQDNISKTKIELEEWSLQTSSFSGRFLHDPDAWQRELVSLHAFGESEFEVEEGTFVQEDQRVQFVAAANYAADNLFLQSVMSGRTNLANINGNIYREGDTISMRDGEIVLDLIELGATYAIIQLADNDLDGDTQRTIYIANSTKLVNGERTP
tara:strand:- start:1181 stop:1804 length:624 start_codon:yes stop_codon:yes gene_type:complete